MLQHNWLLYVYNEIHLEVTMGEKCTVFSKCSQKAWTFLINRILFKSLIVVRTKLTVFNYGYVVKIPLVYVGTPVYEEEHQVIYQGQDFHSVASNSCIFFIKRKILTRLYL